MNRTELRRAVLALCGAAALVGAALVGPSANATAGNSSGSDYFKIVHACSPVAAGKAHCDALQRVPVAKGTPGAVHISPLTATKDITVGPSGGFTPDDLAGAYGVNPNAPTSQVVGIVDAFDDPNAANDLNQFDAHYGLPAETASSFVKVNQLGQTSPMPTPDAGWGTEISLDLDAVRGICHTCKIILVEADTNNLDDLAASVNEAVALGATIVSNSYGGYEGSGAGDPANDETLPQYQAAYNHPGTVILASTGDDGYYDWDVANDGNLSSEAPQSPASYSTVVAAAGTTLQLNDNGTKAGEQVWNENGVFDNTGFYAGASQGASGGGCSVEFNAPTWQTATANFAETACGARRSTGDVAAVADPNTGYSIYDTYGVTGTDAPWFTFGGTSLASPVLAGLWALAGGSHGVAYPALTLYGHAKSDPGSLYDVTVGGNGYCDSVFTGECGHYTGGSPNTLGNGTLDCGWVGATTTLAVGTRECEAGTGWDGPSGVGTPNGLAAFQPLAPSASIKTPKHVSLGHKAKFAGSATDPYPGGSITGYSWTIHRGGTTKTVTGANLSFKFKKAGKYTITLTVTDSYGFKGSSSVKVKIKGAPHHHKHHH